MMFILNGQYNMQHMQLGNQQQGVFTINLATKKIGETMGDLLFQQVLFDSSLNIDTLIYPYFPDPYPYWYKEVLLNAPMGSQSMFYKMREMAVSLNFRTTVNMTDRL